MKKILVVGFGNMGCRHVQSLLGSKMNYRISVVEPSVDNINNNCNRINCKIEDLEWFNSLEEINGLFDLAIVATSSAPRYSIVKYLISKGVKFFLLEKVVFQSKSQFDDVIELMKKNGVKVYCNFVNRYTEAYNSIKNEFKNRDFPLKMVVHGGFFGLGCNAIHYVDIFQYILNSNKLLSCVNSNVKISNTPNKRGLLYKEFVGTLFFSDESNNNLIIISDENYLGGIIIELTTSFGTYILSEERKSSTFVSSEKILQSDFETYPSSYLTQYIVDEIFEQTCRLTELQNTQFSHNELFKVFNNVVFNENNDDLICPIT